MNEWIQRTNLTVFRQLLAAEENDQRREELEQILNEQEARLESIVNDRLSYCATAKARA